MAFFDEIGKKITQTSQDAVQKTKDMAETVRLNGLISDEEKLIQAAYLQIGETYYEAFCVNPGEQFAQSVFQIAQAKTRIATYQEKINKLKGAVSCSNCGYAMPPGAIFCSSCGTANAGSAPQFKAIEGAVSCQACSALMPPDNDFCNNCGSRLEKTESQVTLAAAHAQTQDSQEELPDIQPETQEPPREEEFSYSNAIICRSCGKELSNNAVFCTGCGQKVEV